MNDSRQGFLQRWSSRKSESRQGHAPPPEPPQLSEPRVVADLKPASETQGHADEQPVTSAPSLEDVEQLTPASDFSDFVGHEVPPQVKNAALKKLFADPHFNVMDGLDVYIDDYSLPDPLAPSMLRQMASAKFMNLVEEPPASQPSLPSRDAQSDLQPESEALNATPHPTSETLDHDHADLRLQPDPDAGPQGAGSASA